MSNIYVTEPATSGKVVLKTTVGEIEIELWSKETPKACRNFVQLCMEGYYDDTAFHRLVRGFIVQGGDPTETGEGGESIYGQPFKTEPHSRLSFNRRGLVGMACLEVNENLSQFFFTLGPAQELTGKHTLFGRVVGDTLFNMLRLGEGEVGPNERPARLHRIVNTNIILNPYDDIVPRQIRSQKTANSAADQQPKVTAKATKNFSLLSFGEEAEEEEQVVTEVSDQLRKKGKSAHDLLSMPHLSSVPVSLDEEETAFLVAKTAKEEAERSRRRQQAMLDSGESPEEAKARRIAALQKESESLRQEILASKRSEQRRREQAQADLDNAALKAEERARAEAAALSRWEAGEQQQQEEQLVEEVETQLTKDPVPVNDPDAFEAALAGYRAKAKKVTKGAAREEATMALLANFSARLQAVVSSSGTKKKQEKVGGEDGPSDEEAGSRKPDGEGGSASEEEEDDETGSVEEEEEEEEEDVSKVAMVSDKWMAAQLISEIPAAARKVLDPSMPHIDRYDLYDPRNPLNVRKRGGDLASGGEKRGRRF